MWTYNYTGVDDSSAELKHYGVLGMKLGIRRYQNKDGSLTELGKKRVNKAYKKVAAKAKEDFDVERYAIVKQYSDLYTKGVNAYNKVLKWEYGPDYDKREDYPDKVESFLSMCEETLDQMSTMRLKDFADNNKYHNEGKRLVEEYDMLDWSEAAQRNAQTMKILDDYSSGRTTFKSRKEG